MHFDYYNNCKNQKKIVTLQLIVAKVFPQGRKRIIKTIALWKRKEFAYHPLVW